MEHAGVETNINCLCVIQNELHVSSRAEAAVENTMKIWGITAPMCCIMLHLSYIWHWVSTFTAIATRGCDLTQVIWKTRKYPNLQKRRKHVSKPGFQRKTTAPFGRSPADRRSLASRSLRCLKLPQELKSLRPNACLCQCVLCLSLMGTVCCNDSAKSHRMMLSCFSGVCTWI